jgi:hypothetical protein
MNNSRFTAAADSPQRLPGAHAVAIETDVRLMLAFRDSFA